MQTPAPPQPAPAPRLEGLALASLGLCVAIILARAGTLAAYLNFISDIPGAVKADTAYIVISAVVLAFYAWSAYGIWSRDPRGFRRLRNMSLVFGVLSFISIARLYMQAGDMALFHQLFPSLWLLMVPVATVVAVLHLVASLVAHLAVKKLRPADEYAFR